MVPGLGPNALAVLLAALVADSGVQNSVAAVLVGCFVRSDVLGFLDDAVAS